MQMTGSQQYLIKTDENLIYHFFLSNNRSLHYSIYTSNNTVKESTNLAPFILDFTVTIDKNGKIHLICITNEGELLYYINQNNKWNYKTISRLDVKSNIYRYLMLFVQGGYTHIIYNKTNLLTPMLSYIEHIYWNQNGIHKAVVENYIHGKYPSPLQVSVDSSKNLHLVYKVYYKNNHQLYYSKFNIITQKWTNGELITNLLEDNSHPYIFVDRKDKIHLVWCTIEQNNFILKYKQKANIINKKSKWSYTQTLSNKNSNTLSPIIIQEFNILKIYCRQNDKIVEITSKDFGDTWESSEKYLYEIKDPKIIKYSSTVKIEDDLFIQHIYGNITDVIKTAGINLFIHEEVEEEFDLIDTKEDLTDALGTYPVVHMDIEVIEEDPVNKTSEVDQFVQNEEPEDTPYSNELDPYYDSEQSIEMINELLSNCKELEKQLIEIEEEKQKLTTAIADYESDLNLLEEKLIDYKKQMLILQDKLHEITSHNSIFQRFLNFFK